MVGERVVFARDLSARYAPTVCQVRPGVLEVPEAFRVDDYVEPWLHAVLLDSRGGSRSPARAPRKRL